MKAILCGVVLVVAVGGCGGGSSSNDAGTTGDGGGGSCSITWTTPDGSKGTNDSCMALLVSPWEGLEINDNDTTPLGSHPRVYQTVALTTGVTTYDSTNIATSDMSFAIGHVTGYDCFDNQNMMSPQGSGTMTITSVCPPHGTIDLKLDCWATLPDGGPSSTNSVGAVATFQSSF